MIEFAIGVGVGLLPPWVAVALVIRRYRRSRADLTRVKDAVIADQVESRMRMIADHEMEFSDAHESFDRELVETRTQLNADLRIARNSLTVTQHDSEVRESQLRGETDGLRVGAEAASSELHRVEAEMRRWEGILKTDHEWRIGGKEAVHGRDPRIQYQCAHCPAVIYAEEGTF